MSDQSDPQPTVRTDKSIPAMSADGGVKRLSEKIAHHVGGREVPSMNNRWNIGDRIQDRWEVRDVKWGGMGIVYLVYDHLWQVPMAAKTFQDKIIDRDPKTTDRFMREALAWIRLDHHPNVVRAHFVRPIDNKPYVFMEHAIDSLDKWIEKGRLSNDLTQVLRFAVQFCDGMIHAESKGIKAHRDVKPHNCLIARNAVLKVTDFGLAKIFDEEHSEDSSPTITSETEVRLRIILDDIFGHKRKLLVPTELTAPTRSHLTFGISRSGIAVGTPPYMSPEQFQHASMADFRSDIYGFGVMLFQMATGDLPYLGNTWEEFEELHRTKAVPLIRKHPGLNGIVQTCMAKDPSDRYPSFIEVRNSLAELYSSLTGEALNKGKLRLHGWGIEDLPNQPASPVSQGSDELTAWQWLNKGVSLGNLMRHQEEIACYDKVIALTPNDWIAWTNRGLALAELGRYEEAISCYDKAIEIRPEDQGVWCNKGLALSALRRFDEAIICYDRQLAIDPKSARGWSNKGITLGALCQFDEAITCFDRAIAVDARLAAAWYNKGSALYSCQKYPLALECLRKAQELGNPHAILLMKRCKQKLGT